MLSLVRHSQVKNLGTWSNLRTGSRFYSALAQCLFVYPDLAEAISSENINEIATSWLPGTQLTPADIKGEVTLRQGQQGVKIRNFRLSEEHRIQEGMVKAKVTEDDPEFLAIEHDEFSGAGRCAR